MALFQEPRAPRANPYHHLMFRHLPEEWSDYIPWMSRPKAPASFLGGGNARVGQGVVTACVA